MKESATGLVGTATRKVRRKDVRRLSRVLNPEKEPEIFPFVVMAEMEDAENEPRMASADTTIEK